MNNSIFSKEVLEAINQPRKCVDCGERATITGYCQKHSWKNAKKACPYCGYSKNKYYGGLPQIVQCMKCKDFFKPF